jgi:hypothetical protein
MTDYDRERANNQQHLQLLSIFHYVFSGLTVFVSLFFLIYIFIGIMVLVMPEKSADQEAAIFIGWLFIVIGAIVIAFSWTIAGLLIAAGRNLTKHRKHTFCLVVADFSCLFMPLGTILGIFTLIVLMRPSVKTMFDDKQQVVAEQSN